MFFTLDDYRKIEEYLRQNSKKDTDFPTTEEIHDEDYVPIIQDSTNKKMTVLDLRLGLSIGPRGESAYEVAVRHGYVGTEEDWLASLDGKSAYQIAVELGYVGTEEEWLASLKGEPGDKGEDGKDGSSPILKLSDNGMDILASSDGGETWYKLVPDFNKLRVLGYVDSRNQLPKSANMGDVYGIWNPDVYSGRVDEQGHLLRGAYDLYINTVTGWDLDATITKVYSYDTELPSVAKEGSVAIVPVKDLTLDKEKIDGYKVYKYSIANDGWTLILNTAEIYNSKDDIVNKGDNIYALVQGNGYVTETKLKEETIVSKNDYCRISNMTDSALLLIIVQDSKRMFHSIGTGTYMIPNNCGIFLVNDHDLTDIVVATSMSDPEPKELSSLEYMPEGIYPYYILTENSAGDIYITPQSKLDPESPGKQEGLTIETKITTLLSFSQTYELYKRVVGWVYFGTNASITYHLVQNIEEGTETNVLSGKAVKDAFNELEDELGIYEDNPEYVRVYLDKEGKILWGIQKDGNIYYGAGVPNQVKSYIDEKISELSLDEYEAIVNFLGDLVNSGTLQELLDAKVDKEEGKSLINEEYASTKSSIENPEFFEVTTDSEDKVLEGIQKDGTKVIGGDLNVDGSAKILGEMEVAGVSYKVVENPEYIAAWVDAGGKVIFGLKTDGKTYVGDADFLNDIEDIKAFLLNITDKNIDWDVLSSITAIENPEYIDVKVDSEDKILEGITTEGVKKFNIPVDNGAAIIETTDNPEFLEAKIDSEGRFIEGINRNGEKVFGVIPPQIKQYIDENTPVGGSGVQSIEYDDNTGDMYATYDDESGVTDVSMDPNGDIYVEYETGE